MVNKVKRYFQEFWDKIKTSIRMRNDSVFIFIGLILVISLGILVRCSPIFRSAALIKAFDPWIQYHSTEYLVDNGFFDYMNWHSMKSWYPEGYIRYELRPGLPFTTAFLYQALNFFGINVTLYNVAYFFPVLMGGLTILVMFFLGKEILDSRAGLLAAFFLAFSPGHMQRTVLGFYDNETIGVFAVLGTFLFFIKTVKSGKLSHAVIGGLFLGYLALSWGGLTYGFLLLPLACMIVILTGKYSVNLLIAYMGTAGIGLIMLQCFTLFRASDSFSDMETAVTVLFMGFMLLYHVFDSLKIKNPALHANIIKFIKWGIIPIGIIAGIIFYINPNLIPFGLDARSLSILNPNIRQNINLVASVGEHKPSPWSVFYFNSLIPVILTPLGVFFAFKRGKEEDILMLVFAVTLLYFTGSMIRIILLLAPALALIGAYGLSYVLKFFGSLMGQKQVITRRRKRQLKKTLGSAEAVGVFAIVGIMLFAQVNHATSTSINQMSWSELVAGGSFHDWEESLSFMRENLPGTSVVVSWWDYGYWLTTLGNVTTVNDNGTINQTRIGLTGMAMMQTNELYSVKAFKALQAEYVVVYFGHLLNGLGGDEGKWPWMVRICNDRTNEYKAFGMEEENWYTQNGGSTVFNEADYINSSSGLYEDGWFESTLVKLMFYGEATTVSAAQTQIEAYYAQEIEGNEAQSKSPRYDDNGRLWSDHIPENGQYNLNAFIPYYFSTNHLVKVYKIDYTILDADFSIEEPSLTENGILTADIVNQGRIDLDLDKVNINGINYNYTMQNSEKTIPVGESRSIWVDANQFNQDWEINDYYNVSASTIAYSDTGYSFTFQNTTDGNVVEANPEYSVKIDKDLSNLVDTGSINLVVYANVTNTGDKIIKVSNFTVNDLEGVNPIENEKTGNFIIKPGETEEFKIRSPSGGTPALLNSYDIEVHTVEGASDRIEMVVNKPNYSLKILPVERENIGEELLKDENDIDYTRRLIPIDYQNTFLDENGSLVISVKNTGTKLLGFESVTLNDVLTDYTSVDGDLFIDPGETKKLAVDVTNIDRNERFKIVVSATSQLGVTSASDVGLVVPIYTAGDGKALEIVQGSTLTLVGSDEIVNITVKNVGTASVTVDNLDLNGTLIDLVDNENVEILFGDRVLDNTFDLFKFSVNVASEGIKLNESNNVNVKVHAGTYQSQNKNMEVYVDDMYDFIVVDYVTNSTTRADVSDNILYLNLYNIGGYNLTVDTIVVNGTLLTTADFTIVGGINNFVYTQFLVIEISGAKIGGPIGLNNQYDVTVTTTQGPVRKVFGNQLVPAVA